MRTPRTLFLLLALAPCCLTGFSQQTASFQNAGLTLHYTIAGKGTPIVILSGGPGMDAAYMQPVADFVAQHNTAILLDQRGTTGSMPSTLDATTITPELYLSDLEALRTSLGYKQWIVLGHSAGALTAMRYAIAHPDHTQALLLVGVVPPRSAGLSRMMDNVSVRLSPEIMKQVAALDSSDKSPDAKMAAEISILFTADFFDRAAAAKFAITMTPETCHALTSGLLQKRCRPSTSLPISRSSTSRRSSCRAGRTRSTQRWPPRRVTPSPAQSSSSSSVPATSPGSITRPTLAQPCNPSSPRSRSHISPGGPFMRALCG